ncbi:MAG TPA: oligosaccharide flippase family protein [Gaiellaceae bacterium]|nr:oligosaccharide flippase family protein [Gaiellaceae bacterium]
MTTATVQIDAARGWRTILRRFAALFAGEGAARVIGFVIVLLLARRLGPTGFGIVTFGFTLVAWFSFVADSGTEILNVREIARRPDRFRSIAERVLGLRIALSVVATGLFLLAVLLFARSDLTRSTLVLFALMLPASALNLRWMVLGVGGSRAIALGQVLSRIVVLGGIVLLVADASDIKSVPVLEAVGAYIYALVILVLVGGGIRALRPRVDLPAWRDTLRQSMPLMVSGLARAAVVSFDIILIELALGPRDVGIYGVASKPALFFTGVVGLFSMAFLSAFSATALDSAAALQGRAMKWAFAVGVAVAAVVCVSSLLIPFVFGDAYEEAVAVLAIIAWRIPIAVLSSVYGSVLIARDRQNDVMRNSLLVAGFVVAADLVAVLTVGLLGAAVVSLVAVAFSFVLNRRSALRLVGR